MKSFAADIRPLFRDFDVQRMARRIDLSNYDAVRERADDILRRLERGDMPCDGSWPDDQIASFRQWIADGKLP